MSNKQLTAKLRLDIGDFEAKLNRVTKKINQIDKVVNKNNTNQLTRNLNKASNAASKLRIKVRQVDDSTNRVAQSTNRIGTLYTKVASLGSNIRSKVDEWYQKQLKVASATRSTNGALGTIWSKLKGIAATYLGIMGAKAIITTSDTITAAENKLNYLSGGNTMATQDSMDKMYTSSQKVRMAYTDMMANVSKSMTLAGDAFQGSTDNAIRFQEIMAEAYAVGGASAQEMSTSMYQMIQALGAGILAGDELRSVREGAPLAYKAIEDFAQGIYNTEESLKDLASQGMITSDIVVAAIMKAGDEMDVAFGETEQTFAQTWNQIKNTAVKAFEPVSRMLRQMLNNAIDNGLIEKIEKVFTVVSKVLQIIVGAIQKAIQWMADNWNWLKYVVLGAVILIVALLTKMAVVAVAKAIITAAAWALAHLQLLIIIAAIVFIIYMLNQWKQGAISTCETLVKVALIIAAAIMLIGLVTGNVALLIIGAVIAVVAIIFMYLEQICGGIFVAGAFFKNVGLSIANFFIAVWNWIAAAAHNMVAGIVNVAVGLWNAIKAIATNIGIAFQNAWNGALFAFWNFIADCVSGLDWLSKPLNAIAKLFGKSFDVDAFGENLRARADKYQQKDYVSVSDAWASGMNTMEYKNLGDAWDSGMSTYTTWEDGWASNAYNNGYAWGANVKDSIEDWGNGLRNKIGNKKGGLLDNLGEKLGLDFGSVFPSVSDGVGSGYDPSKALGNIDDNTGDIADSMDLTQEDLEYLRKIADMEWKKEFTTANITVDMSNYNTINGEGDLDGIVTKLTDKLYEELDYMANGVYAY